MEKAGWGYAGGVWEKVTIATDINEKIKIILAINNRIKTTTNNPPIINPTEVNKPPTIILITEQTSPKSNITVAKKLNIIHLDTINILTSINRIEIRDR